MVHCLEDSRASKYGGNYVLYAIDYDICNDNSYQKVANWCSKVLAKKELINIEKRDGRNYYYD